MFYFNRFFDFTDNGTRIMRSAQILFNGLSRVAERSSEYFNKLQPLQHHVGTAPPGLYCYSFAAFPDKFQPSGSANASRLKRIQLTVQLDDPAAASVTIDQRQFDLVVLAVKHNFLRVAAGTAGLAFAD